MTADDIVWEDPLSVFIDGSGVVRRSKWRVFVDELQKRPGKWAVADTRKSGNRSAFGTLQSRLKTLGCDATARSASGVVTLYARWPDEDKS